jgi:hypothetical protein
MLKVDIKKSNRQIFDAGWSIKHTFIPIPISVPALRGKDYGR